MATPEIEPGINFRELAAEHMGEGGLFVYDSEVLAGAAQSLLDIEMPYGMTVRYAAKANPHVQIISQFDEMGLHFDASSAPEAERLLDYGVDGKKISLSSQILRQNDVLEAALVAGVKPVATSLRQVSMLGGMGVSEMAVRINPGIGSGHNNRTNVGGPASPFGIWRTGIKTALKQADRNGAAITRLHTHIGSGADSDIWRTVIKKSLSIADKLPDVDTLDIGGGYSVARVPKDRSTDMNEVTAVFAEELERFKEKTDREIKLEIEPGTYLVALAGTLLGRVEEKKRTPDYRQLNLNVGMNAILRISHYGAQHPIEVLNDEPRKLEYAVFGPCCESGDILTPKPQDPEGIKPRRLNKASIGDIVAIGGAGAYCASMSTREYNDVPPATEIVI